MGKRYIPIIIGMLFVSIVLLTLYGVFNPIIKSQLERILGVDIQYLYGNPFRQLTLKDVRSDIIAIDSVIAEISPIELLRKRLSRLRIFNPSITYKPDSTVPATGEFPLTIEQLDIVNLSIASLPVIGNAVLRSATAGMKDSLFWLSGKGLIFRDRNWGHVSLVINLQSNGVRIDRFRIESDTYWLTLSGVLSDHSLLNFEICGLPISYLDTTFDGTLLLKGITDLDTVAAKWKIQNASYRGSYIGEGSGAFGWYADTFRFYDIVWHNGTSQIEGTLTMCYPKYYGDFYVHNFNLCDFIEHAVWYTDLEGDVQVESDGTNIYLTYDVAGKLCERLLDRITGTTVFTADSYEIPHLMLRFLNGRLSLAGHIVHDTLDLIIDANNFPVSGFGYPVDGLLTGKFRLQGTFDAPSLEGGVRIVQFNAPYVSAMNLDANFGLSLRPPTGKLYLYLRDAIIGNLKQDIWGIETTPTETGWQFRATGTGKDAHFHLCGLSYINEWCIDSVDIRYEDIHLSNVTPLILRWEDGLHIEGEFDVEGGHLSLSGRYDPHNIALHILTKEVPIKLLLSEISGYADAEVILTGTYDDPQVEAHGLVHNFFYVFPNPIYSYAVDTVRFTLSIHDDTLHFSELSFKNGTGYGEAVGWLPFSLRKFRATLLPKEWYWDVQLHHLPFAELFPPMVDAGIAKVSGNLKIVGTYEYPLFYGELSIDGANLQVPVFGFNANTFVSHVQLNGDTITLVDTKVGETLKVTNNLILLYPGVRADNLHIEGTNVEVTRPDLQADMEVELTVDGDLQYPLISGKIHINNAIYTAEFSETKGGSPPPIRFNLEVVFPRNVWVKNSTANMELEGDVRLITQLDRLLFTGDANVKRGHFYYFDRKFEITRGRFSFENIAEFNPKIDLFAYTIVKHLEIRGGKSEPIEDTIKLAVTGYFRDMQFTLSSVPPRPFTDIVSLLVFNVVPQRVLTPDELVVMLPERTISYLLQKQVMPATNIFDMFTLEPYIAGDRPGFRLAAGKYLSPTWFIFYMRDLATHDELIRSEYYLHRRVLLIGERSSTTFRVGVEFKIRY